MYNHTPKDYICPICLGIKGVEDKHTFIVKDDIVYTDDFVTAFISSFFKPNNPGHVIVVPNTHFENIYDLPDEYAHHIMDVSQKMALALKATYDCEGTSLAQHNEPAGGQDAWHYHMHVFPRYKDDHLYATITDKRLAPLQERKPYADKLKGYLSNH